jgi:hypothetical protein
VLFTARRASGQAAGVSDGGGRKVFAVRCAPDVIERTSGGMADTFIAARCAETKSFRTTVVVE